MSKADDILYSPIEEHLEPYVATNITTTRRIIIARIELEQCWLNPESYIHHAAVHAGFDPSYTWHRWDDLVTGNVILEQRLTAY